MQKSDTNFTVAQGIYRRYLVPALLVFTMAFTSASSLGQNLGTLITTPQERAYLDFLRQDFVSRSQLATFNIAEDVIPDIPIAAVEEQETVVRVYRFGGIMSRINGNRILWLNGRQVAERDLPPILDLIDTADGTQLRIRVDGITYQLKPGQSINLVSSDEASLEEEEEEEADAAVDTADNAQLSPTATVNDSGVNELISESVQVAEVSGDAEPLSVDEVLEQMTVDNPNVNSTEIRNILESNSGQVNESE